MTAFTGGKRHSRKKAPAPTGGARKGRSGSKKASKKRPRRSRRRHRPSTKTL